MPAVRPLLSILLCLACSADALAGPLRERIAERRAERAELDEDDGSPVRWTLPAGVRLVADVAYGADPAQRFDAYLPARAADAPLLFMVHGGGWKRGDKASAAVVEHKVAHWTGRGFIVVSTNYRMLPQADPLVQASDVASALAAAQARAPGWGGAPGKTIVMGHSAGAHLVTLLAASGRLADVSGVVALDSAAFDIEAIMQARPPRLYQDVFGSDPAFWRAASPYHQAVKAGPPLLAVCSSRRDDACAQAQRYAAKVRPQGGVVDVLAQDLSHRAINQTLGARGAYTDAVTRFIASVL